MIKIRLALILVAQASFAAPGYASDLRRPRNVLPSTGADF
jgi:hypothetical protein